MLGALTLCAVLAGCGGEERRQDADERAGTYRLEVVRADFPARQRLARQERMVIEVRNAGAEVVPNVAVTVDGFSTQSDQVDLADPERPVFIVDEGPRGGGTAYVGTWALGGLRPGQAKRFEWRVTAVEAGTHELGWRVAAGLDGRAKAVAADTGAAPEGSFDVRVARRPASARVDPETGEVERTPTTTPGS